MRPVEDRRGHDRRYSLDDSLLRSMGYRPDVSFANGTSINALSNATNFGLGSLSLKLNQRVGIVVLH